MDKLDEFRKFAQSKPHLKEIVKQKKMTWQELYERYDIFGTEDEIFSVPTEETKAKPTSSSSSKSAEPETEKKEGLGSILDALSGFDADKISDGLNGMKKILGILSEVTKPEETKSLSKRKMSRPYQRNDD